MREARKYLIYLIPPMMLACSGDHSASSGEVPSQNALDQLHLKKGQIVSCGAPDNEFGTVNFEIAGSQQVKNDFNTAVELLHSFEYDEAEKAFAKIIDESPGSIMAYWEVAMCSFHPLWEPPTGADLKKGSTAVELANSIKPQSQRESAYINAVGAYYKDWISTDAHTRSVNFEKAMEQLHGQFPEDGEATVFYALALVASADPTDKTYSHQMRAGRLLDSMYVSNPNHPGIIHYIIHTYDYPGIADLALPSARRYANVAPSSAHALHMPSHIFTRLGLWDESIQSNLKSMAAARCYAESTGIQGNWDEELHGLDYLVYAYLQKGDVESAAQQLKYLATIRQVSPINFKEAYTFAASPCRAALENKNWPEAVRLPLQPSSFPWERFPWQEAIVHFGRLLGAVHGSSLIAAEKELTKLDSLHNILVRQADAYKANQVEIQVKSGQAWIAHAKGENTTALDLMKKAADMEDSTSKNPVTPGEVLPQRELYGDLLFELHQNSAAFQEYKTALEKSPNRFNSLFGAGRSAELVGDTLNAGMYYRKLLSIANPRSPRQELKTATAYLTALSPR